MAFSGRPVTGSGQQSGFGRPAFYPGGSSISLPAEAWTAAVSTTNVATHFNYACIPLKPSSPSFANPAAMMDNLGLYQNYAFIVHHGEMNATNELNEKLFVGGRSMSNMYGSKRQRVSDYNASQTRSYLAVEKNHLHFEEASIILNLAAINYVLASACKVFDDPRTGIPLRASLPPLSQILAMIHPLGVCVTEPNSLGYGQDDLDVRAFCIRGPVDVHDIFGTYVSAKADKYSQLIKGTPLYYVLKAVEVADGGVLGFNIGNGSGEETVTDYRKSLRWALQPWAPTDGTMRPPSIKELESKLLVKDTRTGKSCIITYTGYYWRVGVIADPPKRHDVGRGGFTPREIRPEDTNIVNRCPLMSVFVDFVSPEMGYVIPVQIKCSMGSSVPRAVGMRAGEKEEGDGLIVDIVGYNNSGVVLDDVLLSPAGLINMLSMSRRMIH